jgi:hypothetical protein
MHAIPFIKQEASLNLKSIAVSPCDLNKHYLKKINYEELYGNDIGVILSGGET